MCRRFMFLCFMTVFLLVFGMGAAMAATVFINEIHYDNASTDQGEAIEIAGPAGTDLTGWTLVLYNGNGGAAYDTVSLSGTISDESDGYGFIVETFPENGLQNGSPDGIALVDDGGTVVQFLSYEGSFTATDGAAIGLISEDIGVAESATTLVGYSLQLGGAGTASEDFTWQSEAANTFDGINTGQSFTGGGGCPAQPANLWINEIHYDNDGGDIGEGVEIAGEAGTDLSCYSLVFYNGSDSQVYMTEPLAGTLADLGDGYGVAHFAVADIQNGAPDGLALVFDDTAVVQFVSYEGIITAADGPAAGVTSEDIGVDQEPASQIGWSLQLTGHGNQYADFSWAEPAAATMGAVNTGQAIDDAPNGGPFKIFHMNDAHSRLLPHEFDVPEPDDVVAMEMVGGAAHFAAKMLELKSANPQSLILDAGDISEGNPLGDLRGNGGMIDFYNLLDSKLKALGGRGIDAVVVGNHDVRSLQMLNNLKPVTEGGLAQFKGISLNVCHYGTTTPYFDPYVIVEVNGTRVGILGYTNDESSYLGDDLIGVIEVKKCTWDGSGADISIRDWVETLRTTEGCDVVILLSHMGQSRVTSGDDALLADSGGVEPPEIVISGHWHTWTERVWQPSNMNGKTIVAEAASYLQYIGELAVDNIGDYVDARKHAIRNSEITPDSDVETLISTLTAEYNAQTPTPPHTLDEVIGYSAIDLSLDKDKWWTVSEYPWNATNAAGAWITDAMVWKAGELGYGVDLAMQSGGGIRRDIAAGEITYVEIYEAYPWSDDNMVRVQMTGQEIWDWIQADHVGTSISQDWLVTAHDGQINTITYQGSPISLSGTYNVAISEYMFAHPTIALSDTTPEDLSYSIREGIVDYTGQYVTPANPMYAGGITPRYDLNTEFAGGFKAVVLMTADSESQPYFEEIFIRLVEAMPATLARRTGYGLLDLVNPDGSIDLQYRFSEIMLYRSHLGFPDGLLQPGDIIEVWGEGSSYDGTPEFIDQEGIYGPDQEFVVYGNDTSLARPEYYPEIASFWDEAHENHYVKFYAEKTDASTVRDAAGDQITVYQPGGYYTKTLPGSVGDILELTGVNTEEGEGVRRFRCHTAVVAGTVPVIGYPPSSSVDPIDPYEQSGSTITLTATTSDTTGAGGTGVTLTSAADAQVVSGYPDYNYGTSTSMYVQSAASGSYLDERVWVKFDLAGQIPTGTTITAATLKLYCWKAEGANMDAAVHVGADDSWDEATITWNTQPAFGTAQASQTLVSGQTGYWYEWDVTAAVTVEAAGDQIASFVVKPPTEGSATTSTYAFDSKEWGSGTVAPVLEISWDDGSGGADPVPTQVAFFYRHAPDGLSWGAWTGIGTDTNGGDGWQQAFAYPVGQGYYQFYSVSTDTDANVEDAPVRADTGALFNHPPVEPTDPGIVDGAVDVVLNPTLSITAVDPDGAPVDVYFYDTNDQLIGTVTSVPSGSTASVEWLGLTSGTVYGWYVVVDDSIGSVQSATWTFTTLAAAAVPAMSPVGVGGLATVLMLLGLAVTRRSRHG